MNSVAIIYFVLQGEPKNWTVFEIRQLCNDRKALDLKSFRILSRM